MFIEKGGEETEMRSETSVGRCCTTKPAKCGVVHGTVGAVYVPNNKLSRAREQKHT